ncbi:MAG: hypothetical protein HC869_16275, partial [Rhodospirillales bacterium]|nr:hypothetical protein [Rhodospirillales bacterium]
MLGGPTRSAIGWLLIAALMAALTALWGELLPIALQIIAVAIAAGALLVAVHVQYVGPWLRARKLKAPCDVRFVIREHRHVQLPHVIQDDDRHIVDELVLPSNSVVEIELGYRPRIPFKLVELVFGCEGDLDAKPFVVEALDRFSPTHTSTPSKGEHKRDIYKFWHVTR